MNSHHFPYKICDSVHGFIRFDDLERKLIDSRPFQRLRYIHQMGIAYLVYPGATHSRFEHSLGVMEVATKAYDVMLSPYNQYVSTLEEDYGYWRRILRLAALCHDLGHLPFSHTAERDLLPKGGHEKMTLSLIRSPELREVWDELGPSAEVDVIKLALSEQELKDFNLYISLNPWEKVLSQIITEDNFGADRIDYLIRDAHHTGVGYGHFDYHQLIDSLRILPSSHGNLTIGIAVSGIQSVESLWIARYLMYARVYFHPKARVYSEHMRRFMRHYYREHTLAAKMQDYLLETDFKVLQAVSEDAEKGEEEAQILMKQKPPFVEIPIHEISGLSAVLEEHGERVIFDRASPRGGKREFPVLEKGGKIYLSTEISSFLRDIPVGGKSERLFVDPVLLPRLQGQ